MNASYTLSPKLRSKTVICYLQILIHQRIGAAEIIIMIYFQFQAARNILRINGQYAISCFPRNPFAGFRISGEMLSEKWNYECSFLTGHIYKTFRLPRELRCSPLQNFHEHRNFRKKNRVIPQAFWNQVKLSFPQLLYR